MGFLSKLAIEAVGTAAAFAFEEKTREVQEVVELQQAFEYRIVIKELKLSNFDKWASDMKNRFELFDGRNELIATAQGGESTLAVCSTGGERIAEANRHESTCGARYSLRVRKDPAESGRRKFFLFRDEWDAYDLAQTMKMGSFGDFKKSLTSANYELEQLGWDVCQDLSNVGLFGRSFEIRRNGGTVALVRTTGSVEDKYFRSAYVDYSDPDFATLICLVALVFESAWE